MHAAVGGGAKQHDEPEVAVLLVACAIGLATGAGVVLFNDVIHAIRHIAWQVSACTACAPARCMPLAAACMHAGKRPAEIASKGFM